MSNDDRPLTIPEEELSRLAAQHEADPLLTSHLSIGDLEGGSIGLLINGMIVVGKLTSSKTFASALDEQHNRVLNLAETTDIEMPEGWRKKAESAWSANVRREEQREDMREEALKRMDSYLNDDGVVDPRIAPQDLMRLIIRQNTQNHLTLTEVTVIVPGSARVTRLPVLRVRLAQVAAWWVPEVDEHGRATVKLFGDDPSEGA